jgi:hypothetical protein
MGTPVSTATLICNGIGLSPQWIGVPPLAVIVHSNEVNAPDLLAQQIRYDEVDGDHLFWLWREFGKKLNQGATLRAHSF